MPHESNNSNVNSINNSNINTINNNSIVVRDDIVQIEEKSKEGLKGIKWWFEIRDSVVKLIITHHNDSVGLLMRDISTVQVCHLCFDSFYSYLLNS